MKILGKLLIIYKKKRDLKVQKWSLKKFVNIGFMEFRLMWMILDKFFYDFLNI